LNLHKLFDKEKIMSKFGKEPELAIEIEINETSNFEELFSLLKQKKEIASSKQKYEASYLIAEINNFRAELKKLTAVVVREELTKETINNLSKIHSQLLINLCKITKKEDLRTKVLELAIRELRGGNS